MCLYIYIYIYIVKKGPKISFLIDNKWPSVWIWYVSNIHFIDVLFGDSFANWIFLSDEQMKKKDPSNYE